MLGENLLASRDIMLEASKHSLIFIARQG